MLKWQVEKISSDRPLKELIIPLYERCPPYTWKKGTISSTRLQETERNINLLGIPQLAVFSSLPLLSYFISPWPSTLHQTWYKILGLTTSIGIHFIMQAPVSCKMLINICIFYFVNRLFVTGTPADNLEE